MGKVSSANGRVADVRFMLGSWSGRGRKVFKSAVYWFRDFWVGSGATKLLGRLQYLVIAFGWPGFNLSLL